MQENALDDWQENVIMSSEQGPTNASALFPDKWWMALSMMMMQRLTMLKAQRNKVRQSHAHEFSTSIPIGMAGGWWLGKTTEYIKTPSMAFDECCLFSCVDALPIK